MGGTGLTWVSDNAPSKRFPVYTRANIGEVYPNPVGPLTWSLIARPHSEQAFREGWEILGAFDRDEFDPNDIEILGCFGGYGYLNVSVMRVFAVRTPGLTPEMIDFTVWGEQADAPPYRPMPSDESASRTEQITATMGRILATEGLPELLDDIRAVDALEQSRPELTALSDLGLLAHLRSLPQHFHPLYRRHVVVTFSGTVALGLVASICGEVLGDPTLCIGLISGLGDVDSAQPSFELWELGRQVAASEILSGEFGNGVEGLTVRLARSAEGKKFLADFSGFLGRHGSRGPDEWEMRSPAWETRPELALAAIDRMRLSPGTQTPLERRARLSAERERLTAEVLDRLAPTPDLMAQFSAGLRSAQVFLSGRERTKTTIVRVVHEMRRAARELGERMVAAGHLERPEDVCLLEDDELDGFVANPAGLHETIKRRIEDYQRLQQVIPPFIVHGEVPPIETWQRRSSLGGEPASPGTMLQGIGGCPGKATGRARIVVEPGHPEGLGPGEILVAPITDPAWTPLFLAAAAVVVDVGALVSHAVIVSRELGIPCVVSATDATRRIRDGSLVTVDGTNGTVTVHD